MLTTDQPTPGNYWLAPIIGTPERIGELDRVTLHHDGHLECSAVRSGERMHLHPQATAIIWPRLAKTPTEAAAIAAAIIDAKKATP